MKQIIYNLMKRLFLLNKMATIFGRLLILQPYALNSHTCCRLLTNKFTHTLKQALTKTHSDLRLRNCIFDA
jgi:hypothetical protein